MFRTIVWFIYFWISLVLRIPSILRVKWLESRGMIKEKNELVDTIMKKWSSNLLKISGCSVEIVGTENIPKDRNVLFVSNHQGNFDIPILVKYIEKSKGFIAKKELSKMPMLGEWMKVMNCVFMDRNNPRESIGAIKRGIELLKQGYSLVIFPEGTRSEDGRLGTFKAGGLKLATKSKVDVVPITIDGTIDIMRKNSLLIKPAKVRVTVYPVIDMNEFSGDTKELTDELEKIISSNLQQKVCVEGSNSLVRV